MSLNATAGAAAIDAKYQATITFPRVGDYPAEFATAYDDYAKEGEVVGAVNTGGDRSIIEAAVRAAQTTPTALGEAFAQYWATVAILPEQPNLSSVNDAATLGAIFAAAVTASVRNAESVPYFEQLITNLEGAAKTVVWTITPPSGAPYATGIT